MGLSQAENMHKISHQIHKNLSATQLIELALSRKEGVLASNQSLSVKTGARTGRSPKDRFIVKDALTENSVDWNATNQAIAEKDFNALWDKSLNYLREKDCSFVSHYQVGADPHYALGVKVITELAWHNLFANNLFIRSSNSQDDPTKQWTILFVPTFKTHAEKDHVHSDAAVILNFSQKKVLIVGTCYAGEMKKAMFSVLNFLLPAHQVLPMHCAANVGTHSDTTLFFGLSGTGKTTLSADPTRYLVGDDEHGWSNEGIFNFEGGCYAKCIDLSREREPVIWDAIRYGALMENVVLNDQLIPDYSSTQLTQNTRVAYPREHIELRVNENHAGHPVNIIFLTCDLHGVLPPVAKLTKYQAAYYFLSGYTALVGSTEMGSANQITQTFSTCFGAPFFPRPANEYADLLISKLELSKADVFLVNTGWTGGSFGKGGERFAIPTTRKIVSAITSGQLKNAAFETFPRFNFKIPQTIENIDAKILNPRNTWKNPAAFDECAQNLIEKFQQNFKKFTVTDEIKNAGPV